MSRVMVGDVADVLLGEEKRGSDGWPEDVVHAAMLPAGLGTLPRMEPYTRESLSRQLRQGDVVLALASPERSLLVSEELDAWGLAKECVALRCHESAPIRPEWLFGWTKSEDFARQRRASMVGIAVPRLRLADLKRFEVPLPDAAQSRKMASIVTTFSKTEDSLERAIGLVRELGKAEIDLVVHE